MRTQTTMVVLAAALTAGSLGCRERAGEVGAAASPTPAGETTARKEAPADAGKCSALPSADDLRRLAHAQLATRRYLRAVLVAQRQMEPEILHAVEAEFRQQRRERGADAGQGRHRREAGVGGHQRNALADGTRHPASVSSAARGESFGNQPLASTATTSISTAAPRGRAATPMVDRAG